MTTKIDNDKLEQYIGELNSLYKECANYKKKFMDQGDNGGGAITQIVEFTKYLQDMQNAFESLVGNTLSYMKQRKISIEMKDTKAAANIQKE